MSLKCGVVAAIVLTSVFSFCSPRFMRAQAGKAASAKNLRCDFALSTTAKWNGAGSPEAVIKPGRLVVRFGSINTDEGTAELRNGTVASEITAQLAARNLHFIQAF